jgi:hypothetical protein
VACHQYKIHHARRDLADYIRLVGLEHHVLVLGLQGLVLTRDVLVAGGQEDSLYRYFI